MKVGDKKQVIVLSIVAVGAIGFVFQQLGGALQQRTAPKILAALAGHDEVPEGGQGGTLPDVVLRDAFAHPKLETAAMKVSPSEAPPQDLKHVEKAPPAMGKLDVPSTMPADPNWFKTEPQVPGKPEENAGKAEKEKETSGTSIRLLATMRASRWQAVVQVGGTESLTLSQGQAVANGFRIKSIQEEGITLVRENQTKELTVGGEAKL